ncbi:MAG: YpdA family putative bacillithiol disulfide reductase [Bacteroidetes bacterium QS_8_64_10]|nr:MAG: YpdA family putative bacillithiol disulfide reductase [Bacteroidetes bacterium QS_8_64_10]
MRDVIIIGAGPVGLACGIEARRRDLDALIIEKGALVNSFMNYPTKLEFFSTPELLEIGGHPFSTNGYKPVREEAIDYYRRVALAEELETNLYETVTALRGADGRFEVQTDKGSYLCRKVVGATGFFDVPNRMHVPGEDLDKVTHYYREPYPYARQEVAVIGAANSAAKAALQCHRHGAHVTLLVRGPAISETVKYWIKPDLENRIEEGSIAAHFNASVEEITEEAISFAAPEGRQQIENDWVLAMTGYRPDYDLLGALGIDTRDDAARTPVHDPETFETNREGLYLAGTVCGGLNTSKWFIENGRHHARQIMEHIAARRTEGVEV